MSDHKQPRCPYCLGEGKLPKAQDIMPATHTLLVQWQTCLGCGGTGRLQADDWREGDRAAGWEAPVGTV